MVSFFYSIKDVCATQAQLKAVFAFHLCRCAGYLPLFPFGLCASVSWCEIFFYTLLCPRWLPDLLPLQKHRHVKGKLIYFLRYAYIV